MTYSGSAGSTTLSSTSSPGSDQDSYTSFDSNLSGCYGHKSIDSNLQSESEDLKQFQKTFSDILKQQGGSQEPSWNQQDPLALHRGLEAITSSLSRLTNTIGIALEEQRNYAARKASNLTCKEAQGLHHIKSPEKTNSERHASSPKLHVSSEKWSAATKNKQMKVPQEIAMAMATKAKLLLRELKGMKQDLTFTKERCMQLEEENKRLRESVDKGARHEEDDLVRLQLEALLAEKARLSQENATYARENQFLHEVVQYHQLKLRELAITDESLAVDEEIDFDEQGVVMDLLPLFPDDNLEDEPLSSACDASQEV